MDAGIRRSAASFDQVQDDLRDPRLAGALPDLDEDVYADRDWDSARMTSRGSCSTAGSGSVTL